MIIDGLLSVLFTVLSWFLHGILVQPDVSASDAFVTSVSNIMRVIAGIGNLTVSDKIFLAVGFVVILEVAILAFKALMFIVHRIPFIH